MSIKQFTILGERCSGTNYLEHMIIKNFKIGVTWEYGWKHFYGHADYGNANKDVTLFIGIVRHPIDWLASFQNEPHHLPQKFRQGWSNFLSLPIESYVDGKEVIEDRNIYTKERYRNIFELRKVKAQFLLDDMPKRVKHFILIRYEDLNKDHRKVLAGLERKFQLKRRHKHFKDVKTYKGMGKKKYVKKEWRKVLKKDLRKRLKKGLDREIERRLDYNL